MGNLGLIISAYLDLAELRTRRHIPMTMQDWAARLDLILQADSHALLTDGGRVSAEIANLHAESEFEKYRIIQDRIFESDYDRYLRELEPIRYGWSKFIIVVPSIAIREGVYKSFQITEEHFAEEYGKKIRYFVYNSAQLTDIDRFASDSQLQPDLSPGRNGSL
ncbi:MAG: virulence RhuM family protein [Desulfovibrio sp.]|nr:virulence RhuM family protein [Desulfovibrio sp.]